jgi:multicomponent K+:H+ antiporter subunit E
MKKLLPHPWLALSLFLMWLLLGQTLDRAHILLGVAVALTASVLYAPVAPSAAPVRYRAMARLFALVLADVVRSNLAVAWIVFGPRRSARRAGFVRIPLETRHAGALAVLAVIVTATPGTSWAGYDVARNILTLHMLELADEARFARDFKTRYENPLREIFE